MNTKIFLTIQSLLGLVFSISMIFFSSQMTERYMMDAAWENPATQLIRQGMGALLLGIAVGSWRARNAQPSEGLNAFLLSSIIGNSLLAIFHINAIIQKVEKPFAWATALLCLLLAAGALMALWRDKT